MYLDLDESDLEGLPDELIKELNLSEHQKLAMHVRTLLKTHGPLAVDDLLIELYRKTGQVVERGYLVNRLFRMKKKGLIDPVEGRKGMYVAAELKAEGKT